MEDKLPVTAEEKRPHHLLVIFLILVFPPAAFYILWKYKGYHSWFPHLMWLSGILLFIYTLLINFFLLPYVSRALISSGNPNAAVGRGWIYVLLVFFIGQSIFGFYLRVIFKNKGDISRLMMALSIFLFGLDYIAPGLIYGQIVAPIYNSLGL